MHMYVQTVIINVHVCWVVNFTSKVKYGTYNEIVLCTV